MTVKNGIKHNEIETLNDDIENKESKINKENINDDFKEKDNVDSNENQLQETSLDKDYNKNRKWYENYFSKVEPGSIRASIFSLSILSIGTGCLSLPQRVGQMSVLLCSIEIILAGFAAYWTLDLLIYASLKSGEFTFSKVIQKICGKTWAKFLDITMVVYIIGVLIIYQILSKLRFL